MNKTPLLYVIREKTQASDAERNCQVGLDFTHTYKNWDAYEIESIRIAQLKDLQFTDTLHRWFQPSNYSKEKNRQQWFWDRLLHDPYNKKKKRKETPNTNEQGPKFFQQTLNKFFK